MEGTTAKGQAPGQAAPKMDEAELDKLIERGSVPNLASLFQQGKEAGLIKPGKEYGNA